MPGWSARCRSSPALELLDWKDFVVGGHDIREGRLFDEAMRMHTESRAIDLEILQKCKSTWKRSKRTCGPARC